MPVQGSSQDDPHRLATYTVYATQRGIRDVDRRVQSQGRLTRKFKLLAYLLLALNNHWWACPFKQRWRLLPMQVPPWQRIVLGPRMGT